MNELANAAPILAASPAPKVGFVSLGCPKALVDSERILTRLRAEGYFDDEDGSDADDTRPTATTATDPEADEDFDDPLLREFDEDLAREAKERDEKDGKA